MQAPVAQEIRADSTDPAPVLSITTPAAQPAKRRTLTEAVVDAIRVRHYSRKTEQAYVHWIRRFVAWSGKRHPRDMGGAEVGEFLTSLAVNDKVSEPTQRQALSALLFLYRQVLEVDMPWLDNIVRAKPSQHLPEVLSRDEVRALFSHLTGERGLILRLMYGSGLRLGEALGLRVKDIDFGRLQLTVRQGKGAKATLEAALAHPVWGICLRAAAIDQMQATYWPQVHPYPHPHPTHSPARNTLATRPHRAPVDLKRRAANDLDD